MGPDDRIVIGTDLVKDRAVLEAAYNDSAGLTAEFNRNLLRVINASLDADFDPEAFEHVAFFSAADSWIEMRLRANGAQRVAIDGADLEVTFADGEEIRTEISAKLTREAVERELRAAGLCLDDFFTDGAASLGWPSPRPADAVPGRGASVGWPPPCDWRGSEHSWPAAPRASARRRPASSPTGARSSRSPT